MKFYDTQSRCSGGWRMNKLETYQIQLKTITPIHIGSGNILKRKECIFIKNKVIIPNLNRFIGMIIEKGLTKEYENFYKNKDEQQKSLLVWLKEHNLSKNIESANWVDYSLELKQSRNIKDKGAQVEQCIKDGLGAPYIPGSSLKGTIRTALFIRFIKNMNKDKNKVYHEALKNAKEIAELNCKRMDSQKYDVLEKLISNLTKNIEYLENQCFCKLHRNKEQWYAKTNDYLTSIRISDSKPLTTSDLSLVRKVDLHTDGQINELNVLREGIYTDKKIEFILSIDTALTNKLQFNVKWINDAIKEYSEHTKIFTKHFNTYDVDEDNVVYIGGGTGFVTKTILYALFDFELARNVCSKILHFKLLRKYELEPDFKRKKNKKGQEQLTLAEQHNHIHRDCIVSPHTAKCIDWMENALHYEMGMCQITVFES